MDAASKHATRALEAIAVSNERLITVGRDLRSRIGVVRAVQNLSLRRYPSRDSPVLEGFVDVELSSGKSVCWWLEAYWGNHEWIIQASVLINDDQGQDTLRRFPRRQAETLDEFIAQLDRAASDLVDSATSMDLASV